MDIKAFKIGDTVFVNGDEMEIVKIYAKKKQLLVRYVDGNREIVVNADDLHI